MKNFKSGLLVLSISAVVFLSACSGNDTKRDGVSNSPAANTEPDSTGLLPRENVKTAQEDYKDTTSDTTDTNRIRTEMR
jgi:hypothetical protein